MQQLTNLTKMISLSLYHLFYPTIQTHKKVAKWQKLIILWDLLTVAHQIQFINLLTYLKVTCYTTDRPYQDVLVLHKPWPHSDISPFSRGCFSWPWHFLHPRCFVYRTYTIHFCYINLHTFDNTKVIYSNLHPDLP